MRLGLLALILSIQASAQAPADPKETLDNWAALYVSFHNSAVTFKELSKRLEILDDSDRLRYSPEELNLKLPKASYDPKLSKIAYGNGSVFQIASLADRKFVIDGRPYVLPEDMGKVFTDAQIASKLSGCNEWSRSAPLQHVGFAVFAFPAAFLVAKHGKWTVTPTCEQQVKSYKEILKKNKVTLTSFACSKDAKRFMIDAKVGSVTARVQFNPWMYTYALKTDKNDVVFLPTGKMRMGGKVCAKDFFLYQQLHVMVDALDPVIRPMLAGNFCGACASSFASLNGVN